MQKILRKIELEEVQKKINILINKKGIGCTKMNIEKTNLKLSVFKTFPYKRLTEVCDAICALGFKAEVCDNGNIVFTDVKLEEPK